MNLSCIVVLKIVQVNDLQQYYTFYVITIQLDFNLTIHAK